MLGYDSKSDTGKSLRSWVKTPKIDEFCQLLLCDVYDFTDHGALIPYMEEADSEETFHMPSTPLKEMYHPRKYVQYIFPSTSRHGFGP